MITTYTWDEETGKAECFIEYANQTFSAEAHCHPDDKDMKSKLMGQNIAETRAVILLMKHIRDNELRPQLTVLNQFYYSINKSKQFNPKSYENRMLQRQIRSLTKELNTIKSDLATAKKDLRDYVQRKEKEHDKIRKYLVGRE